MTVDWQSEGGVDAASHTPIDAGEEKSPQPIPLENQVLYTMYPSLETSWQPTLLFSPFSSF